MSFRIDSQNALIAGDNVRNYVFGQVTDKPSGAGLSDQVKAALAADQSHQASYHADGADGFSANLALTDVGRFSNFQTSAKVYIDPAMAGKIGPDGNMAARADALVLAKELKADVLIDAKGQVYVGRVSGEGANRKVDVLYQAKADTGGAVNFVDPSSADYRPPARGEAAAAAPPTPTPQPAPPVEVAAKQVEPTVVTPAQVQGAAVQKIGDHTYAMTVGNVAFILEDRDGSGTINGGDRVNVVNRIGELSVDHWTVGQAEGTQTARGTEVRDLALNPEQRAKLTDALNNLLQDAKDGQLDNTMLADAVTTALGAADSRYIADVNASLALNDGDALLRIHFTPGAKADGIDLMVDGNRTVTVRQVANGTPSIVDTTSRERERAVGTDEAGQLPQFYKESGATIRFEAVLFGEAGRKPGSRQIVLPAGSQRVDLDSGNINMRGTQADSDRRVADSQRR